MHIPHKTYRDEGQIHNISSPYSPLIHTKAQEEVIYMPQTHKIVVQNNGTSNCVGSIL